MSKNSFSKISVLLLIFVIVVSSNLAAATTIVGGSQGGPTIYTPQKSTNTNHAGEITSTNLASDWNADTLTASADKSTFVEIIIGTDNSTQSNTKIASYANQNGGTITETFTTGSKNAIVVSIPQTVASSFVNQVHASGVSRYVELNGKYQATSVPNDINWTAQWGTQRVGADFAWNTTTGDSDIVVAVIDTGIDYNHPDLSGCYIGGYDFVNNDSDPLDDHGHGTHCAGIIAATINNSIGIAGVAQVKIMAQKGLSASGSGAYTDLANCIINATNAGADILSNSWGGSGDSSLISDAVEYATNQGVLVLVAAGNENSNVNSYPAMYDDVVAVAASNISDTKASFSNYGGWVDVAAPGVMIYSTMPTYNVTMYEQSRFTQNYSYCNGTSMACPMAAGVAALIWSRYPNMDAEAVRTQLESTCDEAGEEGFDIYFGHGVVNAYQGVTELPVQHDLLAKTWDAPSYLMLNEIVVLNLTTANRGAQNETNVTVNLLVNGSIVNSFIITSLPAYTTNSTLLSWTPTETGTYNLSYIVTPNIVESSIANNILSNTYTVVDAPEESNWTLLVTKTDSGIGCSPQAAYSQLENGVVFFKVSYYRNWTAASNDIDTGILLDSDQNASTGMPLDYYWAQENCIGAEYIILIGSEGTEVLRWNSTLRDWDSNSLPLMYLEAPDNFDTFVVGVSADTIDFEASIDCSFLDVTQLPPDSSYWNWMPATGYVPFIMQSGMHDLSVTLETERIYTPNASYTLAAKVFNYGQSNESNVKLKLIVNGQVVNSTTFTSINSGAYAEVRYSWTPSKGHFNITAFATPLDSESITLNNLRIRFVPASQKIAVISENTELWTTLNILDEMNINYDDYYYNYYYLVTASLPTLNLYPIVIYYNNGRNITSTELSVLNQYLLNGGKLIVTGQDSLYYPDAELANVVRAISAGDDNGQDDLFVINSTHPIMNGPFGEFNVGYHISGLYADNDAAKANTAQGALTVAELADGKDKIIATTSLLGTVVFWNGIGTDDWLSNTDCHAIFKNTLIWLIGSSTPSTTTDYDNLWHDSTFIINLSADSEYGIAQTYYRINDGSNKTVSGDGQPQITQESPNNTLEYWSTDIYGYQETHHFLSNIKLDLTTPTIAFNINNGSTYTNSTAVILRVNASDNLSGISQVRYSNDGVFDTEVWETFVANKSWSLSSGDGTKTVYAQIKDNAALTSTGNVSIILDTTPPTVDAGSGKSVTIGDSVTLNGGGSSDSSGIVSYFWFFGDGTYDTGASVTHTYQSVGTFTAILTIEDSAGNTASSSIFVVVNPKSSSTPTATPKPIPTPTATPTPTPSTSPSTIYANVENGSTVQLSVGGNITSTQISNAAIRINQTAATTTISFNVTGEAGTTGFGNLTIPKSQVPLGTSPLIYIDGIPAENQGYTEDSVNYYVWYTTHFSTHELTIIFAGIQVIDTPADYTLWILAVVAVVVVCVVVVFLLLKRRKSTI